MWSIASAKTICNCDFDAIEWQWIQKTHMRRCCRCKWQYLWVEIKAESMILNRGNIERRSIECFEIACKLRMKKCCRVFEPFSRKRPVEVMTRDPIIFKGYLKTVYQFKHLNMQCGNIHQLLYYIEKIDALCPFSLEVNWMTAEVNWALIHLAFGR